MLSTTTTLEIEVDLEGVLRPGEQPTYNDPGADPYVEDVTVTGLGCVTYVQPPFGLKRVRTEIDLLAGIDRANPEIVKLLANIAAALGDEADEALMEAA